jgi:hypothetical protein
VIPSSSSEVIAPPKVIREANGYAMRLSAGETTQAFLSTADATRRG